MRIVDVSESYSSHGGGVRTYVHAKLAAARRVGHDLVIVAPGVRDEEELVHGGRIRRVAAPRSPFDARYGLFVDAAPVHRAIAEHEPDLIEGSSPWLGGSIAGRYPGPAKRAFVFHTDPVAVWAHTFLGHRLGFDRVDRLMRPAWAALRRLSTRFDATIVSGPWLAERLASHGIARPLVVPFGIDKARFRGCARDTGIRAELLSRCGAPVDAHLLVMVGRLDPEKRVGMVLDAFARARRRRPLALVVFGRGSMGRYWQRRARSLPGVHFAGWVGEPDGMARILASADALVHGGAAETFGMAVAEAISAGVPVIVPDIGGAAALWGRAHAERYRAGDADSCARAIERLLCRDPAALRRGCEAAARSIASLDEHFDRLFELYAQMTGLRTHEPGLRAAS
jgi:alpha-1,6-mannosyltransferase